MATRSGSPKNSVRYHLDKNGCFIIDDYNKAKPFSNFFPGVAGVWGIPMWVFFVNRGQGISSFGIEGKDKAILEFQPANKAYRLTPSQGFRTFIKIKHGSKVLFWEPFQQEGLQGYRVEQKMYMTADDLTIQEINHDLGVEVVVNYFTVPGEDYPALLRRVTVKNRSRKKYNLEIADGLPAIMPYGLKDWLVKNLSRTAEAWMKVRDYEKKTPYFHLNVEVSDIPDVRYIEEGNFYFAFDPVKAKDPLLPMIVDAEKIFGAATDFSYPQEFFQKSGYRLPAEQQTSNRTPCAFAVQKFSLAGGKEKEIVALSGFAHSRDQLKSIVRKAVGKGYVGKKQNENKKLVNSIKDFAFTNSSSGEFNLYCQQTFLDNVLRGGLPVSLKTGEGAEVFNVFSRKHGDLERDYNYFTLSPTYFSQGNGNFRDVNQNRRNDIWFNRDVEDTAIHDFFNLQQADGYNPLIVKGLSFRVESGGKLDAILGRCVKKRSKTLWDYLLNGFQPGELLAYLRQNNIGLKVNEHMFLGEIFKISHKQVEADHGEGFWSDHWAYNIDLIESYLRLYPENLRTLLLDYQTFTFRLNDHYILPRERRYLLTDKGVRQYHSVKDGVKEIQAGEKCFRLRVSDGEGKVYETNLLVKLLCLIANKAATLDPSGIGIEMEGDKPNWYDALNGLPGLLGSSLSETYELKRHCLFVLDALDRLELREQKIFVFKELAAFIDQLFNVLATAGDPLTYWNRANDVKEEYRLKIRKGIEGDEEEVSVVVIRNFLAKVIGRIDRGLDKVKQKNGLFPTYFYHDVTQYKTLSKEKDGQPYVLPQQFQRHDLPVFLEGFVHAMRVAGGPREARGLYKTVRASKLFDRELKMYKVNANLEKETEEIGRARIFPPGWLENESVWLHMEYKYLLEILRNGLHAEFYSTVKDALIPFLDPKIYGRSTLENSSFLASSAHEDPSLHGQGFVARLSGSTAEFIHIWLLMNAGLKPFHYDKAEGLSLRLEPVLPGWLFTRKTSSVEFVNKDQEPDILEFPAHTYAFNFAAGTLIIYHNPKRQDTFGPNRARMESCRLTYHSGKDPVVLEGGAIPSPYAEDVRNGKVQRIDAFLK